MIDNDNQNERNEHEFDQIDYKSLSHALSEIFLNDKIYKAANNFEILNFLKGIGAIICNSRCDKLSFIDGVQKLENDVYKNIGAMHVKDIGVITRAFVDIIDDYSKSQWINNRQP